MALQSRALPVLITRPAPQGQRFAQALVDHYGILVQPVLCPLMVPAFFSPPLPNGPFGALILTSETACIAAGKLVQDGADLPKLAYCVGDRTAQVAQQQGFTALSAQGDASALVDLVLQHPDTGPFLHLRGRQSRGDVVGHLRAAKLAATDVVVYDQQEKPLNDAVWTLLGQAGILLVPLFSPRTAEMFVRQIKERAVSSSLVFVTISAAVADMLSDLTGRIEIAAEPTQEGVVNAMDKVIFQT
jgi:uroporphyrinogen-III synthase